MFFLQHKVCRDMSGFDALAAATEYLLEQRLFEFISFKKIATS